MDSNPYRYKIKLIFFCSWKWNSEKLRILQSHFSKFIVEIIKALFFCFILAWKGEVTFPDKAEYFIFQIQSSACSNWTLIYSSELHMREEYIVYKMTT